MRRLALVAALLIACAGSKPGAPDGGDKCTGAVFDLCNSEHDCASTMCQPFAASGFQVCTQACSATMPCPNDSTGAQATCNAMSICKPAAANNCHL